MDEAELCLFVDAQYASPYAMSAFVALCEKNLHFEIRTLDLSKHENQSGEFSSRSITQRIPTLVHKDFSLSESSAIAEYLDDMFPGASLYPIDPRMRARARQVQAWLRSDLMPLRQERSTEVVFYGRRAEPLSPAAISSSERLFSAANELLPGDSDYLFSQWSIADVDLALMLNRLVLHGDAVPVRLANYVRHQWRRHSVSRWLSQVRPSLET